MNFKESFKVYEQKDEGTYKSIYIRNSLIEEINKIAKEQDLSFNKVVIHMLEYCIKEYNEEAKKESIPS